MMYSIWANRNNSDLLKMGQQCYLFDNDYVGDLPTILQPKWTLPCRYLNVVMIMDCNLFSLIPLSNIQISLSFIWASICGIVSQHMTQHILTYMVLIHHTHCIVMSLWWHNGSINIPCRQHAFGLFSIYVDG